MQFTRESANDMTIRRVDGATLYIGETTVTGSVALTADRIVDEWQPVPLDALDMATLGPLLAEDIEVLVLGTGRTARFAPRELIFALGRKGIGLETMDTPAACRTFNILISEGRRPLAILLAD